MSAKLFLILTLALSLVTGGCMTVESSKKKSAAVVPAAAAQEDAQPQPVTEKTVQKKGLAQLTQVNVRDKKGDEPVLDVLNADDANVGITKVDVVVPPPEPTHWTTYAIGTAVGGAVIGTVLFLLSDSDDDKPTKTEVTSSYWREHQAR